MIGPVLAWGLSLVPLAAEAVFELDVPGASELALVSLPWIALAGLPRHRRRRAWHAAALWTALALPPLAFAASLDVELPRDFPWLGVALIAGLVFGAALAAETAAESRARNGYALFWTAFVPGLSALHFALRFAALPGDGPAPPGWSFVERAHPLLWAWRDPALPSYWPVLFGVAVCLAVWWGGGVVDADEEAA